MNLVRRERKIHYVVKSFEKCRPLSASSLVKSQLEADSPAARAGTDTCVLCLCVESLVPLSDAVVLKDAHTNTRLTLRSLILQLRLDTAISLDCSSNSTSQKVCKTCVNRLSSFFLFSKKCSKTAIALKNIQKLVAEKRKRYLKFELPYEDIYKYVTEIDVFPYLEEPKTMTLQHREHSECSYANIDRRSCHICRKQFLTENEMVEHLENIHKVVNDQITDNSITLTEELKFNCESCKVHDAPWSDYIEHRELHTYEDVMRKVFLNKLFCICCLKACNSLVAASQEVIFTGPNPNASPPLTLDTVIYEMFKISITEAYNPVFVCEACINQTVYTYNFMKTLEQSVATVKKCIIDFETSLDKTIDTLKNAQDIKKVNVCLYYSKYFKTNTKIVVKERIQVKILDKVATIEDSIQNNDCNYCMSSDCNSEESSKLVGSCGKVVKKYRYECTKCNKNLLSITEWKKHTKVHNFCKLCCRNFSSVKHFISHLKKNSNKGTFVICNLGSHTFPQVKLKRHLSKIHNNKTDLEKYCSDCGKDERKCIHFKFLNAFENGANTNSKALHKCIECDFLYYYKHELLAHVNKQHLSHHRHSCNICDEHFASEDDLKSHRDCKHQTMTHCPHCDKVLKDQRLLEKHIGACETTYKPFKCDLCNAHFISEGRMAFHRRKHFPRKFQCEFCRGKYWTKSELNGHLKRSHQNVMGQENNVGKVYKCTMCILDFFSKKERAVHITTHPIDSKHICRTCNESFKSRINYYGHLKHHNVKKDCECSVCGKFYTKYNIGKHTKCHQVKGKNLPSTKIENNKAKTKNTMCDICGRLLSNQASLTKHTEIHKEQEQCPHCLKFVNSTIVDRHISTHHTAVDSKFRNNQKRNRKLFNCSKCNYSSIFVDCLEAHENRFHLQVRPFICDICDKGFYAKITLKEHIRTHSGTKPEQCEQCGNRFVSKKALRLHVRIHTGEKPYKCDLCEERFLSASRRQAHRTRKHFEPSVQCQICLKKYYTQSAVRIHIRDYHTGEPRQRGSKKRV